MKVPCPTASNKKDDSSPATYPPNTTIIIGDSMLNGIEENKLSMKHRNVKVRNFPGANIDDMSDYIKPILSRKPKNIILHIGTNDCINSTPGQIYAKIQNLTIAIKEKLPNANIIISSIINRKDNTKAQENVSQFNFILKSSNFNYIDNGNISHEHLGRRGLHLNKLGKGKFAINLINQLKTIYKPYKSQ